MPTPTSSSGHFDVVLVDRASRDRPSAAKFAVELVAAKELPAEAVFPTGITFSDFRADVQRRHCRRPGRERGAGQRHRGSAQQRNNHFFGHERILSISVDDAHQGKWPVSRPNRTIRVG